MRNTISAALLALAISAPTFAQKMGGTNHSAPTFTQTFAAQNGVEVLVEYTAITWADGRTMGKIMDKDNGKGWRDHINENAASQPLGSLRTETALQIGKQSLPKGLYSLYFTIDEDLTWHLNAQDEKNAKNKFSWALDLKKTKATHSRLRTLLTPAEGSGEANIEIAFGQMQGSLALKKGAPAKTESRKSQD